MSQPPPTAVVDIDGVLAGPCERDATGRPEYMKCPALPSGVELTKRLRAAKVRVVLFTSRWESDRADTERWLALHGFEYDELRTGKPLGHVYIDDRAMLPPGISAAAFGSLLSTIRRRTKEEP